VHYKALFAPRKPKIMTLEALKNQQKRRIMKKVIARSKKIFYSDCAARH